MSCKCQECGNKYKVDILIDDEIWNILKPKDKLENAGLLCGCANYQYNLMLKKILELELEKENNLIEEKK